MNGNSRQIIPTRCDFCGIGIGISRIYLDNGEQIKYRHTYEEPVKFKMPKTLTWTWRGERGGIERKTFWRSHTYILDADCYAVILKKLKK